MVLGCAIRFSGVKKIDTDATHLVPKKHLKRIKMTTFYIFVLELNKSEGRECKILQEV